MPVAHIMRMVRYVPPCGCFGVPLTCQSLLYLRMPELQICIGLQFHPVEGVTALPPTWVPFCHQQRLHVSSHSINHIRSDEAIGCIASF